MLRKEWLYFLHDESGLDRMRLQAVQERHRNNRRTKIGQKASQHLCHGMHAKVLKRRTVIQTFSNLVHLIWVTHGGEQITLV